MTRHQIKYYKKREKKQSALAKKRRKAASYLCASSYISPPRVKWYLLLYLGKARRF
jgi:hypothetical protein